MSWTLQFFRRVGQPHLPLPEVEAFFRGHPELTRLETTECVTFGKSGDRKPEAEAHLRCRFSLVPPVADDPGRADFPYEETPLRLYLDYLEPPELAAEGTTLAAELCEKLELLCLDLQSDQEVPLRAVPETLLASYAEADAELRETIAYAVLRRRQLLIIGWVLLAAALLLLLGPALLRLR